MPTPIRGRPWRPPGGLPGGGRLALLALALLAAASTSFGASACARSNPGEVESRVKAAVELIEREGLPAALPRLMDPDGEFRHGEFYLFVLDLRGVIWGNGAFVGRIGENVSKSRDSKGRYFIREMLRVAKRRGHGWVEYEWIDPCTGELAEKQTYVRRAGNYIVGAGLYRLVRA